MLQKIKKWVKWLAIVYMLVGTILFFCQELFIFHPTALAATYQYHFTEPFEEVNIAYDSGINFNLVKFKLKPDTASSTKELGHQILNKPKGIVLYFHGNRENINHYAEFAKNFTANGYEVWMCDYPSFGKSTGTRTEVLLYEEANQIYTMAKAHFATDSIVIYGKSLGTGIAAELASIKPCKQLILETPYYSMVNMMGHYAFMYPVSWMAKFKFPTHEYLPTVKAPITIFHGNNDGVIPYQQALKLKMAMKPTDKFITIDKGTHNNLNSFPTFHQQLDSLLK
jgi:alpha-beta hydrolase superfamily lysophospholipase